MVELALILPLLIMLLIGIIDFGRAYSAQVSITGAAREGARTLALGGSVLDVEKAVQGARGSVTVTSVVQTPCPANSTGTSTATAKVVVSTNFTFGIPFIPLGTKTLNAKAEMRCGL